VCEYLREYLEDLLYPVGVIRRNDDKVGLRVNRTVAWGWIKQEVGDYNLELLSKLR
jgi:hypothetical protein